MKFRHMPRTALDLSEIGFGVWTVATDWWGRIEESDRIKLLQEALDLGVNLFDTADTYGEGYGEEVLAKALARQRHAIVIATKFGYDFYNAQPRTGHQERPQRFEPQFIRFACEQSLRRLKTDYIDLYQLHNPKLDAVQRDEVFETLEGLVQQGKVRYYGSALGPDIGWFEEGEISMTRRQVHSLQIIYSILEQEPARRFFPIAEAEQVGLLSRVPHASEVLTGIYDKQPPVFSATDHRSHRKQEWLAQALKRASMVKFLAEETGRTMAQAAIQFCLAQKTIVSVLPNITSLAILKEYTAAVDVPALESEELNRLEVLWQEGFHLAPSSSDREREEAEATQQG